MTAVVIVLAIVVALVFVVRRAMSDPEFLEACAQVERDLHAARRSREASELKRAIRADGRRLREELRRELHQGRR